MSKLLRHYSPGRPYFVTVVTYRRLPLLIENIDRLWQAFEIIPVELRLAWVVLPDHIHMIVNPSDSNLSTLLQRVKMSFGTHYRQQADLSRGRVWQNRFWDHAIRDENDMNRHIDYIHYNPVKHGLVKTPFSWPHSSLSEYYQRGMYSSDWGCHEEVRIEGDFGE